MIEESISLKSNMYEKFIKINMELGEGPEYKPYTKINSFSSKGRCTRIAGIKTKRVHHLLSDNQLRAFLIFEYNPTVIDIRESWPLMNLMEVIDDKEDINLDKLNDKKTGKIITLTTNFLLTVKEANGNITYKARAVKNCSELDKKITIEKYEIERRYWSALGIEWKVITDRELNSKKQLCKNIQWVRETQVASDNNIQNVDELLERLFYYLKNSKKIITKEVLKNFEKDYKLEKGLGLYLFRSLLGKMDIYTDMLRKIDLIQPVEKLIQFNEVEVNDN